ncbi:MAG: SPOCS domain-containing protein [Halanaerobium sp.]|nr:SPOCS domain-containing protein [Halanaerobium sp.]
MAVNFNQELIRVEYVIGEDLVRETLTEEVTIPDAKPDILRILDVRAVVQTVDTTIEEDGAEITGTLGIEILYVADVAEGEPQQPVHFAEATIDFTNFVEVPGAEPGMNVYADVTVLRTSYNEVEARTLEVTVIISKFAKVTEYRQIEIITDVTGIPEENLVTDLLRIEQVLGENTLRTVVEGELTLPDVKPDIGRILRVSGDIVNFNAEATDEGVIVDGTIEAGITYVAALEDQPVHFFAGQFNFSEVVEIPGIDPDLTAYANVTIQRISYELIDPVTVRVEVLLEIFAKVTEPRQVVVVIDIISDQVEVERELLKIEDVIGEDTMRETQSAELNLPEGKPDIERILEANARIISATSEVIEGGVNIDGQIEGTILYVAVAPEGEPQQPVHFSEWVFPFANFLEIEGADEGMTAYTNVEVMRSSAERVDEDTVEITAIIEKFAKVVEFKQLEIVTNIVSVSPVTEEPCPPSYVVYVVQPGDTLFNIARRYQTTVEAILEANPEITNPDRLEVGQKLCIPRGIIGARG